MDLVFIANTFHGVPEKTELSKAVCEAFKLSSRLAIVNWHRRPREETTVLGWRADPPQLNMDPEAIRQVVEPADFKLEKFIDVGPYYYAAVFRKI